MFKASASLVHECLQSLTQVLDSPCYSLRTTLETIWNDPPEKPVARAVQNFCEWSRDDDTLVIRRRSCVQKYSWLTEFLNTKSYFVSYIA